MALSFPVNFFRSWMLWPQIMSSESNRPAFAEVLADDHLTEPTDELMHVPYPHLGKGFRAPQRKSGLSTLSTVQRKI